MVDSPQKMSVPSPTYSDADLNRLAEDLKRDGICVIRGLFNKDVLQDWAKAFTALFERKNQLSSGLAPREQARYYLTLPWIPPFANEEIFANPVILGILNRVFAQEYVMVQLGIDTPLLGSTYQEIHRDYRPLFSDQVVTPLYALAVNFPLVDITEENGPFQMARGTHVLPRDEGLVKVNSGEIPMESFHMKLGDVMIRTPLALHRGTPNTTPSPRPMVVMGYAMHWLYTPEVTLKVPRGYYDSLPERVKKLLRCEVVDQLPEDQAETYINFKH
jgi:ectoine hydroxylase-related dioxygenase (phytanoyl-CoA dioxygenase family)